ncbi:single-stranded DNA-binding protein [Verrucosispora sp. WMMA2121]|uniref:single-stranded DNA-binding protein n=1 Tax=Verrucosispora sp. WMMA2121 TaxID=3015164 RepID=UPI0022B62D65|nr:single-stranded DNA-binding protein [Verrucosispora sp. WMMA2121]MCZ7418605.1 single-stranded DNA-binding protein [Verrucosispora sp. WMMA2121]
MFDTYMTIVGNVLTAPEWRRTAQSNTLVANFKVASTARRLDRDSGRWVDGNSLRVRVNCWRKLAEGVAASVMVGDPVVVCGRLYTRDWVDDAGNHRTLYELEAVAVGHDLSRGRGRFLRNRPTLATSAVSDADAERRVQGEPTEPVPDDEAPARLDHRPVDDDFELADMSGFGAGAAGARHPGPPGDFDPGSTVGFDPGSAVGGFDPGSAVRSDSTPGSETSSDDHLSPEFDDFADAGEGVADELAPVPADATATESELAVRPEESGAGDAATGRGRRGRGRLPQPV